MNRIPKEPARTWLRFEPMTLSKVKQEPAAAGLRKSEAPAIWSDYAATRFG